MARWYTLASMLLLMGLPASSRAQSDGWGPPSAHLSQAGWHAPAASGNGYFAPGYAPGPVGPTNTVYTQLPDDTGWLYDDGPLETILKDAFRHAYFRVEYLLWDITDPGDNVLGSPTNFVADPTVPFVKTNPLTGATFDAVAPSLRGVFTNDNNGIRATFGLPVTTAGTFEASIFALQTSTATSLPPDVRGFTTVPIDLDGDEIPDTVLTNANGQPISVSTNTIGAVVQSTLIDLQVPSGDNFFLINDLGYQYSLKTQTWGAEGNWLVAPYDPNAGIVVSPMLGVRYLNFSEDLRQSGAYTYTFVDPLTGELQTQEGNRRIDSTAINNIYGPQLGLRAEMNHRWLSLGVQPKVLLGFNSYKTDLTTIDVLAPADPVTGTPRDPAQKLNRNQTTFGIVGDVEVYSKVNFNTRFSLFVGYNLMWAGLVTRPADNIVYNIQSSPRRSAFLLEPSYSGVMIQGLSVGGELRW